MNHTTIRYLLPLLLIVLLPGCVSMAPWNRQLTAEHRLQIKQIKPYTAVDMKGFGVGYWNRDTIASDPLTATLATLVDSAANRTPRQVAEESAQALASEFRPKEIEDLLSRQLREQLPNLPWLTSVQDPEPFLIQDTKLGTTLPDKTIVTAILMYEFSPDLRHLTITGDFRVLSKEARYLNKPQDDVQGSPIYMNRIYYISDRAIAPGDKSGEQLALEIGNIRNDYRDRNGGLTKDPSRISEMNKRIAHAKAERPNEVVAAELTREWTANGGIKIQQALRDGVSEIVRLLIKDMNGEASPIKDGSSYSYSIVEENGKREVRRQNENFGQRLAGTLTSLPSAYPGYAVNVVVYAKAKTAE